MPALRAGGLDTGGERSFDGEDPDVSGEQQLHPLVAGQVMFVHYQEATRLLQSAE
jgi:hypothetical protein